MKLYELGETYLALTNMLDSAMTDDEYASVMAEIENLQDDIGSKGEAYARMIKNMQAEADGYEAEEKRLKKRRQVIENTIDRLKNNLLATMQMVGADEIGTTIGKWRVAKNPPKVVIVSPDDVPVEFTVPQPPKIANSEILKYWKTTGEIPAGCDIAQNNGVRFR